MKLGVIQADCQGQLNKLLHTQILPYATGDDVDSTRELLQRPGVKNILFNQRSGIRKFYHKRLRAAAAGPW